MNFNKLIKPVRTTFPKEMEIKIIIKSKYDDENDINTFSSKNILVYMNDTPVGIIQDLKLDVSVLNDKANLELTFPEEQSVRQYFFPNKDINWADKLSTFYPDINIKYRSILEDQEIAALDEVGTDGHIDHIRKQ